MLKDVFFVKRETVKNYEEVICALILMMNALVTN